MTAAKPLHWSFHAFIPVVLAMLFLDSKWLLAQGLNGQLLNNVLAPIYLFCMYRGMPDARLKRIMLLAIPVSTAGEVFLSMVIGLYDYKFGYVPLYVPFGHAIVIGSAFQLLWRPGVLARARAIVAGGSVVYALLFLGAFAFFGDSFTLLLGLLYFAGVWLMQDRVIYMLMPPFVLFVEFVGTAFGCWTWTPQPFGVLATTNPPLGSVMFYVYLDMIVVALGGAWLARAAGAAPPDAPAAVASVAR